MINIIRHITIFFSLFHAVTVMGIEYVGVLDKNSISEDILKADLLISKYSQNDALGEKVLSAIEAVKNDAYRQYFLFYYEIYNKNIEMSSERANQLLSNSIPQMILAKSLYYESKGDLVRAINIIEDETHHITRVFYARMLITNNLDIDKGFSILKSESEDNNILANVILGAFYSDIGDYLLGNKYLLKAVESDEPSVFYNLGVNYFYGRGFTKNLKLAEKYLVKSLKLGYVKGLFYMLGTLYNELNDQKQAIAYWIKASESGEVKAYYQLGDFYLNNYKSHEDVDKAIEYFELAANNGISHAYLRLVRLHIALYNLTFDNQYLDKAYSYVRQVSNFDKKAGSQLHELIVKAKRKVKE